MRWLDGITDSMDMGLEGDGDGQGGLVCCNSWDCKESDTTERRKRTELNYQGEGSRERQYIVVEESKRYELLGI